MIQNPTIQRLLFLDFAFVLIVLDQISKWYITEHILRARDGVSEFGFFDWLLSTPERLSFIQIEVTDFFNLVMVWNQGVSFGLFSSGYDYMPLILSILALAISAIFLIWLFRSQSIVQMLGIALVIGGALGNVIDRLRFGAVIDFLDFHIMGYHWPAFNLADSCITVGILMLIAYSLFFEGQQESTTHDA